MVNIKCKKCGTKVQGNRCAKCGMKYNGKDISKATPNAKDNPQVKSLIIIGVAFIVFGIILGVLVNPVFLILGVITGLLLILKNKLSYYISILILIYFGLAVVGQTVAGNYGTAVASLIFSILALLLISNKESKNWVKRTK